MSAAGRQTDASRRPRDERAHLLPSADCRPIVHCTGTEHQRGTATLGTEGVLGPCGVVLRWQPGWGGRDRRQARLNGRIVRIRRRASPGQPGSRREPGRSPAGGRAGHDQTADARFCDCCCLTCRNSLLRVITCVHLAVATPRRARHKNRRAGQQRERRGAEQSGGRARGGDTGGG